MLRKFFKKEQTIEKMREEFSEKIMEESINAFGYYKKEMLDKITKYNHPRAEKEFRHRGGAMMGHNVKYAIDAAIGHRDKRHIKMCWEGYTESE